MNILSIEIKAKVDELEIVEERLKAANARYIGLDTQVDTYFQVAQGRLKLRQGNIENSLIRYHRPESKDLKRSEVQLQKLPQDTTALKEILTENLGIKVEVEKERKIFFIDNVKFHLDRVEGLGAFVEIEALGEGTEKSEQELSHQCEYYINYLKLDRANFIDQSYSDLLLK
jgi:adenylate cyclase class 2